ncbi:MAG: family 10 glycosylhydrolase [Tenericutes bacterium]|jgi:uncharacterized lipoprotein YddW (UPF0748 family)|nr:family 10 glycosylhydrolase [Mycoplasmatota bacterium]
MKLFKFIDKEPVYYYKTSKQVEIPNEYHNKPFRAMWVSNVVNIDLPTIEDIDLYQNEIIKMLETCVEFNINAIFFQVRTTNDAFYESEFNPYSRYFTGKEGNKPPYDVLKWIISETRKRNIEFHAWCNPYRISMDGKLSVEDYLNTCDDMNFAKKHPEYIVLDQKGQLILNPAKKEVKDFIIDSMIEIVENYDVDGIHFDDYFYPYSGLDPKHDDYNEFKKQSESLEDFRRNNVNDIVRGVYKAVKAISKDLKFGISPFGIWKNKKPNEYGSHTALGCTESYYGLFTDTLAWIKEGTIDYVVPQIYWEFGHEIAPFADICDFWVEACAGSGVNLYIGHGAYRLGTKGEFLNKDELVNQVKYTNQYQEIDGNVFFTYKNFIEKEKAYPGMQALKILLNGENT